MLKKKEKEVSIAILVKNARKEKGMSARKLAELVDVSHTEINNIEDEGHKRKNERSFRINLFSLR